MVFQRLLYVRYREPVRFAGVSKSRLNDENYFIRFYSFMAFQISIRHGHFAVFMLCACVLTGTATFGLNNFHGKQHKHK